MKMYGWYHYKDSSMTDTIVILSSGKTKLVIMINCKISLSTNPVKFERATTNDLSQITAKNVQIYDVSSTSYAKRKREN